MPTNYRQCLTPRVSHLADCPTAIKLGLCSSALSAADAGAPSGEISGGISLSAEAANQKCYVSTDLGETVRQQKKGLTTEIHIHALDINVSWCQCKSPFILIHQLFRFYKQFHFLNFVPKLLTRRPNDILLISIYSQLYSKEFAEVW